MTTSRPSPSPTDPKQDARREALRRELEGTGVLLPEDEARAVAERVAEWNSSLRPWNQFELWLTGQVAAAAVQVERCQKHEALLRIHLSRRAEARWDDDRRLAAEVLAADLPKQPSLISRRLQETPQGCDWIIERWEELARCNDAVGDWTGPQRSLALDLLGTPAEFRDGLTRIDLEPGRDARAYRAAIAEVELARLREAQATVLAEIDGDEREAAEMGMGFDPPRSLVMLRRHEATCQRRLRWALEQFRRARRSRGQDDPAPARESVAPMRFDPQVLVDEEILRDDSLFADLAARGRGGPKPTP